ncbi:hypothetical protein PAPYR_4053 [Paratrimastix pyriformis]|uniref:Uncharacterized protein n=1 Tax=Paratrimastix pyriformis TaxID=342808 RepID=A0ABQ8UPK6_9EUKA|nr:hypothetical protein PAPYR_4053 [Paratrimastix pyriformis]
MDARSRRRSPPRGPHPRSYGESTDDRDYDRKRSRASDSRPQLPTPSGGPPPQPSPPSANEQQLIGALLGQLRNLPPGVDPAALVSALVAAVPPEPTSQSARLQPAPMLPPAPTPAPISPPPGIPPFRLPLLTPTATRFGVAVPPRVASLLDAPAPATLPDLGGVRLTDEERRLRQWVSPTLSEVTSMPALSANLERLLARLHQYLSNYLKDSTGRRAPPADLTASAPQTQQQQQQQQQQKSHCRPQPLIDTTVGALPACSTPGYAPHAWAA